MYKNLVMYRNELKNRIIPKYKVIGITAELILSKEIFKRNNDLTKFLKDIFFVEYKEYVMKSRTMIMARTCRLIYEASDEQFNDMKKELIDFVSAMIDIYKNEGKIVNEKNPLSGWVK